MQTSSQQPHLVRIACAILLLTAFPQLAFACSCTASSAEERFDSAEHVFVARIVRVEDRNPHSLAQRVALDEELDEASYGLRVAYEVEHLIKGDPSEVLTSMTASNASELMLDAYLSLQLSV